MLIKANGVIKPIMFKNVETNKLPLQRLLPTKDNAHSRKH